MRIGEWLGLKAGGLCRPAVGEPSAKVNVTGAGASSDHQRVLRERLYQPAATGSDVAAYLDAAGQEPAGPTRAAPGSAKRSGAGRGRWVVVGAAASVIVTSALLVGRVQAHQDAPASVSKASTREPAVLLDPGRRRAFKAMLAADPTHRMTVLQRVVEEAGVAAVPGRSANSASLSGSGTGPTRVPLGPLGTTAAGHALTVIVASIDGRYRWRLTSTSGSSNDAVLAAAVVTTKTGAVSGTSVPVPMSARGIEIAFDLPRSTPFAYTVIVSNRPGSAS